MTSLTIEQRIERLEAIEKIKQLKHAYAAACDNDYNPQQIAALFVANGVWEGTGVGRFEGRPAIEELFTGEDSRHPFAAHLVLNEEIDIDDSGDTARGRWWLLWPHVHAADGIESAHWALGQYHDTYRRVDGHWYLEHLVFVEKLNTPTSTDWSADWRRSVDIERSGTAT